MPALADVSDTFPLFLVMLGIAVCWIFYVVYFNARLAALVVTWLLRRFSISRNDYIKIESVAFNLLGGKIMFKGVYYANRDYSMRLATGHINFRYWAPKYKLSGSDKPYEDDCRISCYIYGLSVHVYNNGTKYDELQALLRRQKMASSTQSRSTSRGTLSDTDNFDSPSVSPDVEPVNPKKGRFWELVPTVFIQIFKLTVVAGNPFMSSVLEMESRYVKGTYATDGVCRNSVDVFRQDLRLQLLKTRVRIVPNNKQWHVLQRDANGNPVMKNVASGHAGSFDAKADGPMRGFEAHQILQSSDIELLFVRDVPGLVTLGSQSMRHTTSSLDSDRDPELSLTVTLGKGSQICYGPSENRLRVDLQQFFFPWNYTDLVESPELNIGEFRQPSALEFICLFSSDMNIALGFDNDGVNVDVAPFYSQPSLSVTRPPNEVEQESDNPESGEEIPRKSTARRRLLRFGSGNPATSANVETLSYSTRRHRSLDGHLDLNYVDDDDDDDELGAASTQLENGQQSSNQAHSATALGRSHLRTLSFSLGAGSRFDFSMPLTVSSNGFSPSIIFFANNFAMNTDLRYEKLLSCKSFQFMALMNTPLQWNGKRVWVFDARINKPELHFLKSHVPFLQRLANDWTAGPPLTLERFLPIIYEFRVTMLNYELLFCVNELNIIESTERPDNSFLVFSGKVLTASFVFDQSEFQNPVTHTCAFVRATELSVGLQQSVQSTIRRLFDDPSRPFLTANSFELAVDSCFHNSVEEINLDTVAISFNLSGVKWLLFGFFLRHLIFFRDNYFGDHQTFLTKREFEDTRNVPAVPREQGNAFELSLALRGQNITVLLPVHLYQLDADCPSLTSPQLTVDIRSLPSYLDLQVDVAPIAAVLLSQGSKRDPKDAAPAPAPSTSFVSAARGADPFVSGRGGGPSGDGTMSHENSVSMNSAFCYGSLPAKSNGLVQINGACLRLRKLYGPWRPIDIGPYSSEYSITIGAVLADLQFTQLRMIIDFIINLDFSLDAKNDRVVVGKLARLPSDELIRSVIHLKVPLVEVLLAESCRTACLVQLGQGVQYQYDSVCRAGRVDRKQLRIPLVEVRQLQFDPLASPNVSPMNPAAFREPVSSYRLSSASHSTSNLNNPLLATDLLWAEVGSLSLDVNLTIDSRLPDWRDWKIRQRQFLRENDAVMKLLPFLWVQQQPLSKLKTRKLAGQSTLYPSRVGSQVFLSPPTSALSHSEPFITHDLSVGAAVDFDAGARLMEAAKGPELSKSVGTGTGRRVLESVADSVRGGARDSLILGESEIVDYILHQQQQQQQNSARNRTTGHRPISSMSAPSVGTTPNDGSSAVARSSFQRHQRTLSKPLEPEIREEEEPAQLDKMQQPVGSSPLTQAERANQIIADSIAAATAAAAALDNHDAEKEDEDEDDGDDDTESFYSANSSWSASRSTASRPSNASAARARLAVDQLRQVEVEGTAADILQAGLSALRRTSSVSISESSSDEEQFFETDSKVDTRQPSTSAPPPPYTDAIDTSLTGRDETSNSTTPVTTPGIHTPTGAAGSAAATAAASSAADSAKQLPPIPAAYCPILAFYGVGRLHADAVYAAPERSRVECRVSSMRPAVNVFPGPIFQNRPNEAKTAATGPDESKPRFAQASGGDGKADSVSIKPESSNYSFVELRFTNVVKLFVTPMTVSCIHDMVRAFESHLHLDGSDFLDAMERTYDKTIREPGAKALKRKTFSVSISGVEIMLFAHGKSPTHKSQSLRKPSSTSNLGADAGESHSKTPPRRPSAGAGQRSTHGSSATSTTGLYMMAIYLGDATLGAEQVTIVPAPPIDELPFRALEHAVEGVAFVRSDRLLTRLVWLGTPTRAGAVADGFVFGEPSVHSGLGAAASGPIPSASGSSSAGSTRFVPPDGGINVARLWARGLLTSSVAAILLDAGLCAFRADFRRLEMVDDNDALRGYNLVSSAGESSSNLNESAVATDNMNVRLFDVWLVFSEAVLVGSESILLTWFAPVSAVRDQLKKLSSYVDFERRKNIATLARTSQVMPRSQAELLASHETIICGRPRFRVAGEPSWRLLQHLRDCNRAIHEHRRQQQHNSPLREVSRRQTPNARLRELEAQQFGAVVLLLKTWCQRNKDSLGMHARSLILPEFGVDRDLVFQTSVLPTHQTVQASGGLLRQRNKVTYSVELGRIRLRLYDLGDCALPAALDTAPRNELVFNDVVNQGVIDGSGERRTDEGRGHGVVYVSSKDLRAVLRVSESRTSLSPRIIDFVEKLETAVVLVLEVEKRHEEEVTSGGEVLEESLDDLAALPRDNAFDEEDLAVERAEEETMLLFRDALSHDDQLEHNSPLYSVGAAELSADEVTLQQLATETGSRADLDASETGTVVVHMDLSSPIAAHAEPDHANLSDQLEQDEAEDQLGELGPVVAKTRKASLMPGDAEPPIAPFLSHGPRSLSSAILSGTLSPAYQASLKAADVASMLPIHKVEWRMMSGMAVMQKMTIDTVVAGARATFKMEGVRVSGRRKENRLILDSLSLFRDDDAASGSVGTGTTATAIHPSMSLVFIADTISFQLTRPLRVDPICVLSIPSVLGLVGVGDMDEGCEALTVVLKWNSLAFQIMQELSAAVQLVDHWNRSFVSWKQNHNIKRVLSNSSKLVASVGLVERQRTSNASTDAGVSSANFAASMSQNSFVSAPPTPRESLADESASLPKTEQNKILPLSVQKVFELAARPQPRKLKFLYVFLPRIHAILTPLAALRFDYEIDRITFLLRGTELGIADGRVDLRQHKLSLYAMREGRATEPTQLSLPRVLAELQSYKPHPLRRPPVDTSPVGVAKQESLMEVVNVTLHVQMFQLNVSMHTINRLLYIHSLLIKDVDVMLTSLKEVTLAHQRENPDNVKVGRIQSNTDVLQQLALEFHFAIRFQGLSISGSCPAATASFSTSDLVVDIVNTSGGAAFPLSLDATDQTTWVWFVIPEQPTRVNSRVDLQVSLRKPGDANPHLNSLPVSDEARLFTKVRVWSSSTVVNGIEEAAAGLRSSLLTLCIQDPHFIAPVQSFDRAIQFIMCYRASFEEYLLQLESKDDLKTLSKRAVVSSVELHKLRRRSSFETDQTTSSANPPSTSTASGPSTSATAPAADASIGGGVTKAVKQRNWLRVEVIRFGIAIPFQEAALSRRHAGSGTTFVLTILNVGVNMSGIQGSFGSLSNLVIRFDPRFNPRNPMFLWQLQTHEDLMNSAAIESGTFQMVSRAVLETEKSASHAQVAVDLRVSGLLINIDPHIRKHLHTVLNSDVILDLFAPQSGSDSNTLIPTIHEQDEQTTSPASSDAANPEASGSLSRVTSENLSSSMSLGARKRRAHNDVLNSIRSRFRTRSRVVESTANASEENTSMTSDTVSDSDDRITAPTGPTVEVFYNVDFALRIEQGKCLLYCLNQPIGLVSENSARMSKSSFPKDDLVMGVLKAIRRAPVDESGIPIATELLLPKFEVRGTYQSVPVQEVHADVVLGSVGDRIILEPHLLRFIDEVMTTTSRFVTADEILNSTTTSKESHSLPREMSSPPIRASVSTSHLPAASDAEAKSNPVSAGLNAVPFKVTLSLRILPAEIDISSVPESKVMCTVVMPSVLCVLSHIPQPPPPADSSSSSAPLESRAVGTSIQTISCQMNSFSVTLKHPHVRSLALRVAFHSFVANVGVTMVPGAPMKLSIVSDIDAVVIVFNIQQVEEMLDFKRIWFSQRLIERLLLALAARKARNAAESTGMDPVGLASTEAQSDPSVATPVALPNVKVMVAARIRQFRFETNLGAQLGPNAVLVLSEVAGSSVIFREDVSLNAVMKELSIHTDGSQVSGSAVMKYLQMQWLHRSARPIVHPPQTVGLPATLTTTLPATVSSTSAIEASVPISTKGKSIANLHDLVANTEKPPQAHVHTSPATSEKHKGNRPRSISAGAAAHTIPANKQRWSLNEYRVRLNCVDLNFDHNRAKVLVVRMSSISANCEDSWPSVPVALPAPVHACVLHGHAGFANISVIVSKDTIVAGLNAQERLREQLAAITHALSKLEPIKLKRPDVVQEQSPAETLRVPVLSGSTSAESGQNLQSQAKTSIPRELAQGTLSFKCGVIVVAVFNQSFMDVNWALLQIDEWHLRYHRVPVVEKASGVRQRVRITMGSSGAGEAASVTAMKAITAPASRKYDLEEWLQFVVSTQQAVSDVVFSIPELTLKLESFTASAPLVVGSDVHVSFISEFRGPLGVALDIELYQFLRTLADSFMKEIRSRQTKSRRLWGNVVRKVSLARSFSSTVHHKVDAEESPTSSNLLQVPGANSPHASGGGNISAPTFSRHFRTQEFQFEPDIRLTSYEAGKLKRPDIAWVLSRLKITHARESIPRVMHQVSLDLLEKLIIAIGRISQYEPGV